MVRFRSEFNGVPNTYNDRLTALIEKLTTWCQQQLQFQRQRGSQRFHKIFMRADCSIFGAKSTYLRKLKKLFTARQHCKGNQQRAAATATTATRLSQTEEQQQLQFVAALLISTQTYRYTSSSDMTILDDTYIWVRDEYPDIDAEIRAILLAHAQHGITISSIKDEYRQITGNTFPLHDNVTDFLLTIPHVTAECCKSGKRIFNIKSTDENRHLHEMVMQQRQRDGGHIKKLHYNNNYNKNNNSNVMEPPRLWRSQYRRRYPQNINYNLNIEEKLTVAKVEQLQPLAKAATTREGVYLDNWKHLNNQYQLRQLTALNNQPNSNNNNHNNNNNINHIINNNNNHLYSVSSNTAQLELAPMSEQHHHDHHHHHQQQQEQHHLQQQQQQHLQQQHQPQQVEEYTHGRRAEFTPTPTTLSCPSQHDSMFTINSDQDAYLLDFPLMGDDFFLYLARMELKCRFKKYEKVLQSGLCVSGQTINAARQRIQHVDLPEMTQIIVNIGSVDIMRGKPLVQIEHDFRQLIKEMHNRRFVPVLTTLAPLANYRHDKQINEKVSRFNKFIRTEGRHLTVIDIHSCLISENGVVHFDCFQNGPRSVTGSQEPYVFWNKIGRQRVLQMIEQNLEYY